MRLGAVLGLAVGIMFLIACGRDKAQFAADAYHVFGMYAVNESGQFGTGNITMPQKITCDLVGYNIDSSNVLGFTATEGAGTLTLSWALSNDMEFTGFSANEDLVIHKDSVLSLRYAYSGGKISGTPTLLVDNFNLKLNDETVTYEDLKTKFEKSTCTKPEVTKEKN